MVTILNTNLRNRRSFRMSSTREKFWSTFVDSLADSKVKNRVQKIIQIELWYLFYIRNWSMILRREIAQTCNFWSPMMIKLSYQGISLQIPPLPMEYPFIPDHNHMISTGLWQKIMKKGGGISSVIPWLLIWWKSGKTCCSKSLKFTFYRIFLIKCVYFVKII